VGSTRRTRSWIHQSGRHSPARGCGSPGRCSPTNAVLVALPPQADPTVFSIFMERPGAKMNSWPGKHTMGTTFIGRIPLACNAGTCCIVANQEPVRLIRRIFRARVTKSCSRCGTGPSKESSARPRRRNGRWGHRHARSGGRPRPGGNHRSRPRALTRLAGGSDDLMPRRAVSEAT
jgi:hypothetical protein